MGNHLRRVLHWLRHLFSGDPRTGCRACTVAPIVNRLLGCRCQFADLAEATRAFAAITRLSDEDIPALAQKVGIQESTVRGLIMVCRYCLRTVDMLEDRDGQVSPWSLVRLRDDGRKWMDEHPSLSKTRGDAEPPDEFVYYAGAMWMLLKMKGWEHL